MTETKMITRKEAKEVLGKYKSMQVTWKKFDCGGDGCGECACCKYLNFLDWATGCAPLGSTIQYNKFIDKYLKLVYGV